MQTIHSGTATGGRDKDLFKVAMLAGGVFLLWRAGRALKGLALGAFGLAWVAHWSGFGPW